MSCVTHLKQVRRHLECHSCILCVAQHMGDVCLEPVAVAGQPGLGYITANKHMCSNCDALWSFWENRHKLSCCLILHYTDAFIESVCVCRCVLRGGGCPVIVLVVALLAVASSHLQQTCVLPSGANKQQLSLSDVLTHGMQAQAIAIAGAHQVLPCGLLLQLKLLQRSCGQGTEKGWQIQLLIPSTARQWLRWVTQQVDSQCRAAACAYDTGPRKPATLSMQPMTVAHICVTSMYHKYRQPKMLHLQAQTPTLTV